LSRIAPIQDSSSIGVLAITNAGDFDGVAEIAEDDAVILSAKAVERRLDALEALDVAFLRFQKSGQRAEDLNGDGLGDGAKVGFGLVGEDDSLKQSACRLLLMAFSPWSPNRSW